MNYDSEGYSFKKYLKKYAKQFLIENTDLCLKDSKGETKKIADAYPNIEDITLYNYLPGKYFFDIDFSLSNRKNKKHSCRAILALGNNIVTFPNNHFFIIIQNNGVTVNDKRTYNTLCRKFIKYCLFSEMEKLCLTTLVGWVPIDGRMEYIPVTKKRLGTIPDVSIFNYLKLDSKDVEGKTIEICHTDKSVQPGPFNNKSMNDIKEFTNNFQQFFYLLKNQDSLIGLFSYTIHSLLWYYVYPQTIEKGKNCSDATENLLCNSAFAVCLYGKDYQALKRIANLFSNITYVDMIKAPNKRGNYYISATSLQTKFKNLLYWESMPVIITTKEPTNNTSKKTSFNRSSTIVKSFHSYKKRGVLKLFPVYLNDHPINADEIIDLDMNEVKTALPIKEELKLLKEEISYLLLKFVTYLSKIQEEMPEHSRAKSDISGIYEVTVSSFINDNFDIEENIYSVLLYSAIKGFCLFLKYDLGLYGEAEQLLKQSAHFFFNKKQTTVNSICKSEDKKFEILYSFWKYLQKLFSDNQENEPFLHCIADDKGDTFQGKCYYLSFRQFFGHYKEYLNGSLIVRESELKKSLKDENLLVLRGQGNQTSIQRHIKNKKETLLIIKKEQFEQFISQRQVSDGLFPKHTD